jgi:hypothetical protein
MGHGDSRMVERVYGRLSSDLLGERIAATLGCDAFVTSAGGFGWTHWTRWTVAICEIVEK